MLLLLASCTSEPELPDLPDVEIDLPTGPTTDTPSVDPAPTVPTDLRGLGGRLCALARGVVLPRGHRDPEQAEAELRLARHVAGAEARATTSAAAAERAAQCTADHLSEQSLRVEHALLHAVAATGLQV